MASVDRFKSQIVFSSIFSVLPKGYQDISLEKVLSKSIPEVILIANFFHFKALWTPSTQMIDLLTGRNGYCIGSVELLNRSAKNLAG